MTLSMAGFAANDALMKAIAPEVGFYQTILLRGIGATLVMALLAWRLGALRRLPPRGDWPWLGLRGVAEIGATLCYLTALVNLPLATVSAIAQTMPLMITVAGAVFLAERVGWRRWAAVGVGFGGVLLILRPGGEAFDPAMLWALSGVVCFTVRDLATRRLSGATHSALVTLATAFGVTVMGGVGALAHPWNAVEPIEMAGIAVTVGFILAGYYCGVVAMRSGDVGFVAPFRYSVLIWALLIGYLAFDERPDGPTWIGAGIVVAAGLYTFFRERRLARA
ncbi:MAG: DMT family transporter [Pseudomonadota bacterium]